MYIFVYLSLFTLCFSLFFFCFFRWAGKTAVYENLFLVSTNSFIFIFFLFFLFCGCLFALYPDEIEVYAYYFFFCTIFLPVSSCEVFFLTATFVCRLDLRRKGGAKNIWLKTVKAGEWYFCGYACCGRMSAKFGEEEKSVCMCIHKTTEKICRQMYTFF